MIVLLLVADSLRADAPSFAGGEAQTKTLDALAASGTRFEAATASGSWTIPSLMALATGRFPHRLGVCRWRHPFPPRCPTLFSAFQAAGFETRALFPNPRWAFASCPSRGWVGNSQEPDQVVTALGGARGQDRFVFVHHWWTHLPYLTRRVSRPGFLKASNAALEALAREPSGMARKLRGLYLRAVEHFSEELLPLYLEAAHSSGEKVLVCLTGDHGESFGECVPAGRRVEHVFDLHGRWLTDATLQVPLVFQGDTITDPLPRGPIRYGFARGVDVAPTLCALAGIPWPGPLPVEPGPQMVGDPGPLDGLSLEASLREGSPAPSPDALTLSTHNTLYPDQYPSDPALIWRRSSLKTTEARFVWDGVDGLREMALLKGSPPPSEETIRRVWERLARVHSEGRGGGLPLLPEGFSGSSPEGTSLEHSLRTLGYLD